MHSDDIATLKKFLGEGSLGKGCGLYLPKFSGQVKLKSEKDTASPLTYAGDTFSERDVRSAHYITTILGRVLDTNQIQVREPATFATDAAQTSFLFGSRSNSATQWAVGHLSKGKLFGLEFDDEWRIRCNDGKVFALADPSRLDRGAYESKNDYGVICRLNRPGGSVFMIVGLGGRATEGCGYYFSLHWKELYERYKDRDFAVVLSFAPPIDPKQSTPVAWYGDGNDAGGD